MLVNFFNNNMQLLNYFKKNIIWLIIVFINICYLNNAFSEDEPINTSVNINIPLSVTNVVDKTYTGIQYESKFVPPDGKILLIGGQDRHQITDLTKSWGIIPGGFACYFGAGDTGGIWSNQAVEKDTNNIQNAKWLAETYPNSVLQMALWMVGSAKGWGNYCANFTNGKYDTFLDNYCNFAKSVHRPIFLRIGYEFDGAHNMFEPNEYIKAYHYIVDYIRKKDVSNIAFVWHSEAHSGYKKYSVMEWYPGDTYVDWFGLSVFHEHVYFGKITPYLEKFVDLAL